MDLTPEEAVTRLQATGYAPLFAEAFPEEGAAALTFDNVAKAIAAFERTLITPGAPFDRYLEGDADALTAQQKAGLDLFVNSGCAGCHRGRLLGGEGYASFSHAEGKGDVGRQAVTGEASDRYVFRIAPLRNVAQTYPYFHDGSATTLEEAVSVMGSAQLGRTFNEAEVDRLVAFLEALTGEFPTVPYPQLPRTPQASPPDASAATSHGAATE
jgi:cytochrome c peroxidase